jgi:uncharacterized protein (TIGR02246 family)
MLSGNHPQVVDGSGASLTKGTPMSSVDSLPADETSAVAVLYEQLLASWNGRDAATYAGLFAPDGNIVGFDGSQVDGPAAIAAHLGQIFADYPTPTYVAKIREVRLLTPDVVLLRAVAGLLQRGQTDLNPAANTIQSLVAVRSGDMWRVALFQNTPAQFHGRPELADRLTAELRELLP